MKLKRVVTSLLGVTMLLSTAGGGVAAIAEELQELEARYSSVPADRVIGNGGNFTVEAYVNANDTTGKDGSKPTKVVFNLDDNAAFSTIPKSCNADTSSISDDKKTLNCDIGALEYGTSARIQVVGTANGPNGAVINPKVTVAGATPGTVNLDPLTIKAAPKADLTLARAAGADIAPAGIYTADENSEMRTAGIPFAVWQPVGASSLIGDISFKLKLSDASPQAVADGTQLSMVDTLQDPANIDGSKNFTQTTTSGSCGYFFTGYTNDSAFPAFSPNRNYGVNEAIECTVTKLSRDTWEITVTNYNNSLANRINMNQSNQTLSGQISDGKRVDAGWIPVVVGSMNFDAHMIKMFADGRDYFGGNFEVYDFKAQSGSDVITDHRTDNNTGSLNVVPQGSWSAYYSRYNDPNTAIGTGNTTARDGLPVVFPGDNFYSLNSGSTGINDRCTLWDDNQRLLESDALAKFFGTSDTKHVYMVANTNPNDHTQARYYALDGAPGIEYLYTDSIDVTKFADLCASGSWSKTAPTTDTIDKVRGVRVSFTPEQDAWAKTQPISPYDKGRSWDTVDPSSGIFRVALIPAKGVPADTRLWTANSFSLNGGSTWYSNDAPLVEVDGVVHTRNLDSIKFGGSRILLTKDVSVPEKPSIGDTAKYTVKPYVKGDAGLTATINVADVLPAGLEVDPNTISNGGKYDSATRTITWSNLSVPTQSDQVALTYSAKIVSTADLRNVATATSVNNPWITDLNGYNKATAVRYVTVPVDGQTQLDKTVSSPTFAYGGTDSWKVSIQNRDSVQPVYDIIDILPYNGDGRGTSFSGTVRYGDVTLSSNADAVVYYTSADPKTLKGDPNATENGEFGKPSALWSTTRGDVVTAVRVVGKNLGTGASVDVNIPFTPVNNKVGDKYFNQVWSKATTTKLQMIQANNAATVTEKSVLQIDKRISSNKIAFAPGRTITYPVVAHNAGTDDAPNVVVNDLGGQYLKDVKFTKVSQGTFLNGEWEVGTLPKGGKVYATVTAVITDDYKGGDIINDITISNPSHPVPSGANTPNDTVESDTDQFDSVVAKDESHVTITKKTLNKITWSDTTAQFEIRVKSDGVTTAPNVKVHEYKFDNLKDVTITSTSQGRVLAGGQSASIGDMQSGSEVVLQAKGTVIDPTKVSTNFASLNPEPAEYVCPDASTDCDSSAVNALPLLKLDKELISEIGVTNKNGVNKYRVTVKNVGGADDTNVSIEDFVHAGDNLTPLRLVNAKGCTVSGLTCTAATLKPGQSASVEVEADPVDPLKPTLNRAEVTSSTFKTVTGTQVNQGIDKDTDRYDAVPTAGLPELKIDKKLVSSPLYDGKTDVNTYHVTVKNVGGASDSNIEIIDPFADMVNLEDANVQNVSDGASAIIEDGVVRVTKKGFAPNEEITFEVTAKPVDKFAKTVNTAFVVSSAFPEPSGKGVNDGVLQDKDRWDAVEYKGLAKIQLNKSLTKEFTESEDGYNHYKIEVLNAGDSDLTNVTVQDTVEKSVNLDDIQFYGDVKPEIGTLPAGEMVTLQVKGKPVDPTKETLNTATVTSNEYPEPLGAEPNDTVQDDTDQYDSVPVPGKPVLKIVKTVKSMEGDKVTFQVDVTNDGGRPATGTVITDLTSKAENLSDIMVTKASDGEVNEDKTSVTADIEVGEVVTLEVTAKIKDIYADSLNSANVEGDLNPAPGTCNDNETLAGDDDQCDVVVIPAKDKPAPTPEDPIDPADPEIPVADVPTPKAPKPQIAENITPEIAKTLSIAEEPKILGFLPKTGADGMLALIAASLVMGTAGILMVRRSLG